MKTCSKCKEIKSFESFYRNKRRKDGHNNECINCHKSYDNKTYAKQYYQANKELLQQINREYHHKHREHRLEYHRKYRQQKPYVAARNTAKRRALVASATPKWLTQEHWDQINELYLSGNQTQKEVDHIVPLVSPFVCGLHVPWNLQLLEPIQNKQKSNKL